MRSTMFFLNLCFKSTVLVSLVLVISAESSQGMDPNGCKTESLQGQSAEATTSPHSTKESLKIAIRRETEPWRGLSFGFTDDLEVTNGLLKFQRGQNSDVIITIKHLTTETQNAGEDISEQVVNIPVDPDELFPFKNWTFVTLEVVIGKLKLNLEGFAGIYFNQIDASIFRKLFIHTMQGQDVSVGFNCIKGDLVSSSLPEENNQNISMIAGVTVSVIFIIIIIIICVLALHIRRKKRKKPFDVEQGKGGSESVESNEENGLLYAPENVDDSTNETSSFPTASDRNGIFQATEVETPCSESCNPTSTSKTDSKLKDGTLDEEEELLNDSKRSNELNEEGKHIQISVDNSEMNDENISTTSVKSIRDQHISSDNETSCNESLNLASESNPNSNKRENMLNEKKIVSIDKERENEKSDDNGLLRSSGQQLGLYPKNEALSSIKSGVSTHDDIVSIYTDTSELVTKTYTQTRENANAGDKGKSENRNQNPFNISVDFQQNEKEILPTKTSLQLTDSLSPKKREDRDLLSAERSICSESSTSTKIKSKNKQMKVSSKRNTERKIRKQNCEVEKGENPLISSLHHDYKADESSETKSCVCIKLSNSSAVNISGTSHDNKEQNTDKDRDILLTSTQLERDMIDATKIENNKDSKENAISTSESHKELCDLPQAENSSVENNKISLECNKNSSERQLENNLKNAIHLISHSVKDSEIVPSNSSSKSNAITQSQLPGTLKINSEVPLSPDRGTHRFNKNSSFLIREGTLQENKKACEHKVELTANFSYENCYQTDDNIKFNNSLDNQPDVERKLEDPSIITEKQPSLYSNSHQSQNLGAPQIETKQITVKFRNVDGDISAPMETTPGLGINIKTPGTKRHRDFECSSEEHEHTIEPPLKKQHRVESQKYTSSVKPIHADEAHTLIPDSSKGLQESSLPLEIVNHANEELLMDVSSENSQTNNEFGGLMNAPEPLHTLPDSDDEMMGGNTLE